ncbi:hypothetical protein GLAREA_07650 [Glarea lozoyensis ATCC 20868]|uniref:Uncharacterized protein n=1 Tax=Glarea lozoyensis (strain ATCC 20868 / MF5171) TaxID=1116229 RepID=S3DKD0_GLAL2|nr:uncharacterized protein GLAREA_07650 [Glarea lozoyensis ATCC 20868]EPE32516.1 hypothetical protein GLAREA_07650 [Glarea lozoyensis ATCC 20868]
MKANNESATYTLGLAICFILVAFIFHSLGSNRQILWLEPLCAAMVPTESKYKDTEREKKSITTSDYDRGFKDGLATSFKLKVHEEMKMARTGAKTLASEDKRVQLKLAEMDKQEAIRQSVFDANMKEIKNWREERLLAIWEQKRAREKSIMTWFRKGSASKVNSGTKAIEWRDPIMVKEPLSAHNRDEKKDGW